MEHKILEINHLKLQTIKLKNVSNFLKLDTVHMDQDVNFCIKSRLYFFKINFIKFLRSSKKLKIFGNFSYKKSIDELNSIDVI